jgi:choline-sulfatase
MMLTSRHDTDPLMTVIREDSFVYARGELPGYLERLRKTGRAHHARALEKTYSL